MNARLQLENIQMPTSAIEVTLDSYAEHILHGSHNDTAGVSVRIEIEDCLGPFVGRRIM